MSKKKPRLKSSSTITVLRFKYGGQTIHLQLVNDLGRKSDGTIWLGHCDSPEETKRKIKIVKRLKKKALLEVILHECVHLAKWELSETEVEKMGKLLASVLWKLGYRSIKEIELK